MTIDLMTTEFLSCALFSALPRPGMLFYQGIAAPHFQKYKAIINDDETTLIIANIIRRNEVLMWEGAKDLLSRAVKDAETRIRGVYTFELLAFNAQKELDSFKFNELAQVLVNSSLRLNPGDEMLIRYSSAYGILRKLVDEPWGKMNFITSINVLADEPASLYSLMARALKKAESIAVPAIIYVNDLSAVPLYDSNCVDQQKSLNKFSIKIAKKSSAPLREFWVEGVKILPKG